MHQLKNINFKQLQEFLTCYDQIKSEHRRLESNWGCHFFSLNPASAVLSIVIFGPMVLLAVAIEHYNAAVALGALILFHYFFGYFPYHKEIPTIKKVSQHISHYRKSNDKYKEILQTGNQIAKAMGLSFSDKGFFYTKDKKHRVAAFKESLIKYHI